MRENGELSNSDLYRTDEMPEWRPLSDLVDEPSPSRFVEGEADAQIHRFRFTRHPEPLTRFVKGMLLVSFCVALLSIWSDWLELELLKSQYTEVEAEENDNRQSMIALLSFAVFIVTGVAFLKWIYRANLNSRGFGAEGMAFTPGWAVGYYFVPIMSLYRPYQAMKEIWQVSSDPVRWKSESGSPLLGCWWALWLAAAALGQIGFRLSMNAKTIETLRAATHASIIAAIVDLMLCLIAWAMVSAIAARQAGLVERGAPET